jgi:nicotinate dehydrogenase subunit B
VATSLPNPDGTDMAGLEGASGWTRRQFLFGAGALIITFSTAASLLARGAAAAAPPAPAVNPWAAPGVGYLGSGSPLSSWIAITADGRILISQSQPDVGTGAQTGMLQIAADELYVPFERVSMLPIDSSSANTGGVGGSTGVHRAGAAVRLAAATARETLRSLAAAALGVAGDTLVPRDGAFHAPDGRSVTYAQLVAGKQLTGNVDPNVHLRSSATYEVVGTPVPRIDIPAKLTGTGGPTDYLVNQRVPGMVHARLLRPPAYGAQLLSYDARPVLKMPGVIAVVPLDLDPEHVPGWNTSGITNMEMGQFVAVVATNEWAAIQGVQALAKTARWTAGEPLIPQPASNTYEYLATLPVFSTQVANARGSMVRGFAQASRQIAAEYSTPYLANAPIGPSTGMVWVKPGEVEVWSDSQNVFSTQTQVANLMGLPTSAVTVHNFPGSGVYGRGWNDDAVYEALFISRAIGLPVRVQWMRQEEFQWSTMQGPKFFRMRGGLSGNRVTAFQFDVYTDKDFGDTWMGQNGIAIAPLYTFPHISQVIHYVSNPMRKGLLRAVGAPSNCFAVESFMDELAYAAGVDPLEFRLSQLSDPRAIAVLRRAAEAAGWKAHTKPSGRGLGIATFFDPGAQTYVADVAQVAVDRSTGQVRVERMYVGFDCGLVVNPNGVRLQIEGGTIQATSWCMKESVRYANGMVQTVDWISYPILHFSEVPEVVPLVIDRPDIPPGGVGELATMPVSAAIANAIYDATGARVRSWPFTPDKVKAALAAD